MDTKKIIELAQVLNTSGLTALEICENDIKIRLEKAPSPVTYESVPVAVPQVQTTFPQAQPQIQEDNFTEITSNMVGVFYKAPSPDSEPYVKVGDKIKKGDIICIIEAMKLMNEFTSPVDGVIEHICINDGDLVEYGQCMFKIK